MLNTFFEKLRGARRIGIFAAVGTAALVALLLNGTVAPQNRAGKTLLEQRVERILSRIDGAGSVCVMINEDDSGEIVGAVIVADELRDVESYLRLQGAVCAALNVDLSRVCIIGGRGAFGGDG